MTVLTALQADLTTLDVDAIVNAANENLCGRGGVESAIHRAPGPALLAACRRIGTCPTGEARLTPGFALPARHVIHTVGPVWHGGQANEAALLASCYRNSLALADSAGIARIAFPAISTGVYGYPAAQAAPLAVATVRAYCTARGTATSLVEVIFCCFSDADLTRYRRLLAN